MPTLKEHLLTYAHFSEDEISQILSCFEEKVYKKKEHTLKADEVEHFQYFIIEGCVRGYVIDFNGKEHNITFGFEGFWFGDIESFVNQTNACYNFQALENLKVLAISKKNWDELIETIPAFVQYASQLFKNAMVFQQKRISNHFMLTAEERYFKLIESRPDILQRISLKNIATYLGVTPEFISILRKKSLQK